MTPQQHFTLAIQHYNSGRLQEAFNLCQLILVSDSNHADAMHLLGIIHRRMGDHPTAIDHIRRAIAINPICPDAHFNLGNALRDQGQLDDAISAYRRSIALKQNVHQSYHNLACLMKDKGLIAESEAAFAQAKAALNSAIQQPLSAIDWYQQGNVLSHNKQFAEAVSAYHHAIALQPEFAEAYCNLGNALVEEHQLDLAIAAYLRSININANLAEAHHNLAKVYYDRGQLDEAIAANRWAIAVKPDYSNARRNLAGNLFETGQLDQAIATYRQAIGSDESANTKIHSDLIYILQYHQDYDARAIFDETRRWNQRYALPLARFIQPHTNDRTNSRRLRIGYVSPDFRNHVVGKNLLPLFREHDHERFEIFCYCDVARPDTMTQWFKNHADAWTDVSGLSDQELASPIRADQVDILVDLALHTQGNRLLTFARKPAPVQVSFAAYPGSTGLTAIDYRLSDPYLDPPGMDETVYSEKTIRLLHSFWCFDSEDCQNIPVSPLPADKSGHLTFGCLNNFCKINNSMLDLWASILQKVPESRLLLLAKHGQHRQRTIDYLAQLQIAPDRVEFISYCPRPEYLRQYHRIDISLDSFPCNGHATSLDSFWMGVPVVTLVGQTLFSRAGWCQLSNLGLSELAAHTPESYVQIAAGLADDLTRLRQLRLNLRDMMQRSPLMDAKGFAAGIEAAYRQMWGERR